MNSKHWALGGKGALELAEQVIKVVENKKSDFHFLYESSLPLVKKMRTIAQKIYGAADIEIERSALKVIENLESKGYGHFPICVAKTQMSFSTNPKLRGAPEGHVIQVREVRLAAGAEFIVMVCGEIMTMPGLPREPAAMDIDIDEKGNVIGLS